MSQQLSFPGKELKSLSKGKHVKHKKKEENLQILIAKYLRMQYPDVIFNSDVASGMRLTIGQAVKCKMMRSSRGQPDLIILEPSRNYGDRPMYGALCLELKNERSDVYLKDGTISLAKSSDHVREQAQMLDRLRQKGFFATFVFGFEDAKKVIDIYLRG